ncbi:MAG: HpcH/HpaI aldolase/citrate lyase family protein [Candidatus Obscuribacter sp.]|nr:HpcH/HpaI aldolase/citrate lyase family protein [Candidatus Obscuribacter sp.]
MMDHRLMPSLGGMLFVPTTLEKGAPALIQIANGQKFPNLRTVIFDLEDSVKAEDVPLGMENLRRALPEFWTDSTVQVYVRARDASNLSALVQMPGIERIHGFVLPKLDTTNVKDYFKRLPRQSHFAIMPILETMETFSTDKLLRLRDILDGNNLYGPRIQCVLIGAMDLLKLLRIQPDIEDTIYDTVIAGVIDNIVLAFTPAGYKVSGTIYRGFGEELEAVLSREVELDTKRGMFSKLAIHPRQIEVIEAGYAVSIKDLLRALAILAPDAPGVFKLFGEMVEPVTQIEWAKRIFARVVRFGLSGGEVTAPGSSARSHDLQIELKYKHLNLTWSQHWEPGSPDRLAAAPVASYLEVLQLSESLQIK